MMNRLTYCIVSGLLCVFFFQTAFAKVVEYDLTLEESQVDYTGETGKAMTVNQQIPAPTLTFTEGDIARIHVHNKMSMPSSVHWHGILLPNDMDGVPYVTYPPIAPGETFTYEFPIRQSGTYWYHSHSSLQEQVGLYGGIHIHPALPDKQYDQEHLVVLSEWTNMNPHEIMRLLKKGDDWFSVEKGSSQTIFGALLADDLAGYVNREFARMPPMDLSDVSYDRFLANGKTQLHIPAQPEETVRLRMVDGSSMTFFYLEFAGGPMTIISADGQPVVPLEEQRFLISVAETYDIVVKTPGPGAYELRATAQDGSGYTSIWIGEGEKHFAPDVPNGNLYLSKEPTLSEMLALTPSQSISMSDRDVDAGKFDEPGMHGMKSHHVSNAIKTRGEKPAYQPGEGKKYKNDFGMFAGDVALSYQLAAENSDVRPWPPYKKLRSPNNTSFSPDKPVREIRMTLDGDMERYVWSIDNKVISEEDIIEIKKGEAVRFIMINRTMMHHPMHLHGHFFRVINGQGDHSPLKHTIDVAPMSTTVIEFDADAEGDWFFHCHLLYHMKAGMERIVHYEDFVPSPAVQAVRHKILEDPWYSSGAGHFLSNYTEGYVEMSNTRYILKGVWEIGWAHAPEPEAEIILTAARYFNRFFNVFAGADLGNGIPNDRGILGFEYLLPLNFIIRPFIGTDGGWRVDLDKTYHLTPRIDIWNEFSYDSETKWENQARIMYKLNRHFALSAAVDSDYGYGLGFSLFM